MELIREGAEAPDFAYRAAGEDTRLAARRGVGPTLLLFYPLAFAPVCREDLGALNAAAEELGHPHTQLLAISVDRVDHAQIFLDELEATHLVAVEDPELTIAAAYGTARKERVCHLASVLVDAEGKVAHAAIHDLCFPRPLPLLTDWIRRGSPARS